MPGSTTTLAGIMATKPDVDLTKIDATTEADIARHIREEVGWTPAPGH